jgi:MFS family permease
MSGRGPLPRYPNVADTGAEGLLTSPADLPAGGLFGFEWLNRDLEWLFLLRIMRSVAQGYLGIIVPLYMAILGYDAVALGSMLAVSALAAAGISTATGLLADRFGRKNFLAIISLLIAIGGVGFGLSNSLEWLIIWGAIGSVGRGGAMAGGAWGAFYPAVQALIADSTDDYNRTTVFGAFSFVGVLAGAMGSLLAGLPLVLHRAAGVPILEGYRGLFMFSGVIGVGMALGVIPVRETHTLKVAAERIKARDGESPHPAHERRLGMSRESWRLVIRFMITNSTSGLAIGMLGPIVVYWFYRRFGVTSGQLASMFFILNVVASVPYLMAGRIALMFGSVRSVVVTRLIGAVMLFGVALMPTFVWAATLYGIRMLFNVLSIPVRQSYLMGVIISSERATASGFSNFPAQVTSAAGPYMAGYFMEHLFLDLPLEFAAVMQAVNAFLYWVFFRNVYPPEEIARRP